MVCFAESQIVYLVALERFSAKLSLLTVQEYEGEGFTKQVLKIAEKLNTAFLGKRKQPKLGK